MKKMKYIFWTTLCVLGISSTVVAQNGKELEITSSFKPVMREASKITFNAQPPLRDTVKPRLSYNIPSQQLAFNYQTAILNPLAYANQQSSTWENTSFVKAGIGNVHLPYLKAGLSFGNGENAHLNILAEHISSKGKIEHQKHNQTNVQAIGTYRNLKNMEWMGAVGYKRHQFNYYGYDHDAFSFTKEQVKQLYSTIEGQLSLRNLQQTETGFNYNPSIKVSNFSDYPTTKASETNMAFYAPVEKYFNDNIGVQASLLADFTTYKNPNSITNKSQNNSLYQLGVNALYKNETVFIKAGVIPSWDNKEIKMLPNITADITTSSQLFTLQLGWIGYYNKGSFQRFASINPWIARPDSLLNQSVIEAFMGIKGSIGDHLTFAVKGGLHTYRNTPLFVNDELDGKTFLTLYESKMNVIQIKSELGYTVGEKLNVKGGFEWRNFRGLHDNIRAWGMIPLQFNVGMGWQPLKDLMVNVDLNAWSGPRYRKFASDFKGENVVDLGIGASYKLTKNIEAWVRANNLLNQEYQRWNQYQTYGFNVLGGVVVYFNQKK